MLAGKIATRSLNLLTGTRLGYGFPKNAARSLSSTTILRKKSMPPRPKVDENDIEEKFLKGSGPGGQKISHCNFGCDLKNKTSSAVQLRHIPTGIVVKSQETRSREQNRKIARQLLASKLEDIEKGDESRNNVLNEVARKKKASKRKKSLRKYRKLEEGGENITGLLSSVRNSSRIPEGYGWDYESLEETKRIGRSEKDKRDLKKGEEIEHDTVNTQEEIDTTDSTEDTTTILSKESEALESPEKSEESAKR